MKVKETIELIKLQNKVDIELDKAIKLIAPIVATGKKLTKRETKKAEALLKENNLDIRVYLSRDYFSYLKLFHTNRLVQIKDNNSDYQYTAYINDDSRSIMLDKEEISLSLEELNKYDRETEVITEEQIKSNIKEMTSIKEQIKALESKKWDIKYRSYLE